MTNGDQDALDRAALLHLLTYFANRYFACAHACVCYTVALRLTPQLMERTGKRQPSLKSLAGTLQQMAPSEFDHLKKYILLLFKRQRYVTPSSAAQPNAHTRRRVRRACTDKGDVTRPGPISADISGQRRTTACRLLLPRESEEGSAPPRTSTLSISHLLQRRRSSRRKMQY